MHMNFTDCVLLTLVNTAICIALPKMVFSVLNLKTKRSLIPQPVVPSTVPVAVAPGFNLGNEG